MACKGKSLTLRVIYVVPRAARSGLRSIHSENIVSSFKLAFFSALVASALIAALTFMPGSALAREALDRVVALVNSEPITFYELKMTMRMIPEAEPEKVLEEIINAKLLDQEVESRGIFISDEEVKRIILKRMEELNLSERELEEKLKKEGLSIAKLKEDIRDNLTKVKIIRGGVKVTDADMRNYYNQNIWLFHEDDEVRLSRIFLPFPIGADEGDKMKVLAEAGKLYQKAKSGADFAELARKYSLEEQAADGGDLGFFAQKDLIFAYAEHASKMKAGDISPVIETDLGCHIIKITEKKGGGTLPFDEVKDKVSHIVYDIKLKEHIDVLITELRSKARIERRL